MTATLLVVGLLGLFYVHGGYGALLHIGGALTGRRLGRPPGFPESEWPAVTILVSAFNEAGKIAQRIANVADLDYPRDRLELLIVSDGSTDGTAHTAEQAALEYVDLNVRVVDFAENQGRHAAQNLAAREALGTILVTTDSDSAFAPDFVKRMVEPFSEPGVAVVGGEKRYKALDTGIAQSIGVYQRVEYWTRAGEDRWNLLAKTDGPCTAFLREIWDELEEFEDVDHAIVALAWDRGYVARHAADAACYELPNETARQEIKARARMTRKGLLTIRKRWPLRRFFGAPGRTFALYSHRHVRFCSPLFLVMTLTGAAAFTADLAGPLVLLGLVAGLSVVTLSPSAVPVAGAIGKHARSFLLANWGFTLGIVGFLRGDRSGRYNPTHARVSS